MEFPGFLVLGLKISERFNTIFFFGGGGGGGVVSRGS